MMNIVLLDAFTTDQGESPWPGLSDLGAVTIHPRVGKQDLKSLCAMADAIVTNKVVIDGALIRDLQPRLRYVGVCATGTNIVDVDTARALGVAVTNVPSYSTTSVAQLTMAMLLQLTMDVAGHDKAVKDGAWAASSDFCFFLRPLRELAGKTLVLVGKGAIGGAVGCIAEAFGMTAVAAAVPGSATPAADRVPLSQALGQADVVSLHCPLTPATRNLVNRDFLSALKPDALLINTSRGGLVNEDALVAALNEGRLGGVALDVVGQEPPPANHPLLNPRAPYASRVLVTPHVGWGTVEARARLRGEVVENLRAFTRGQRRNRVD